MTFWQELREKVKQNKTGTDITVNTLSKIRTTGIREFVIVKPAFYFGQLYTLCLDYIEFVEDLLSSQTQDREEIAKGLLYIREAARSLSSNVKEVAVPLENLILELDDRYEEKKGGKADTGPEEEEKDEFAEDEGELSEKLRLMLGNLGIVDAVSQNLSKVIAGLYRECVHFVEGVSELFSAKDGDLETVLGIVLDIQYGLEWQMRFLVADDVSTEDGLAFSPGLLTWSALALSDLVPSVKDAEKQMV